MKTTDSVMREFDEKFTKVSWTVREWTMEDVDLMSKEIKDFISHSLAKAEKKAYKKGWTDAEKNLAKIMGVANKMIDGLKNYRPITGDNPEEAKV